MNDSQGSGRRGRRAAAAFIFVTVALDIIASGVVGPVWPQLIQGFLHGDTSRSAMIFGVFATAFAVMQLIFMPILGGLSDRFGRRPVILISCFGLALDYVIMAVAPNLAWLFVGRILSGAAAASMATANAYIADVTPPEERAGAFGMLSAAFGIGFILGPLMGGLFGQLSPRLPFWIAAGLTFLNAAYGLFVLPESLSREHRAPFSLRMANPIAALGVLTASPQLAGLSVINFVARLVHAVFAVAWTLYAAARYGWGPAMIGVSLVVVGASSLVVSMLLVRPTVARIGERNALILGLMFGVAGFALLGWAPQGWMFLASIAVLCLWGLASPAIQSLMTRLVGANEQGRLQGANAGVTAIAGVIGPPIFAAALAFGATPAHAALGLMGLPFYLAAAFMLIAVGVGWRVAGGVPQAQAEASA